MPFADFLPYFSLSDRSGGDGGRQMTFFCYFFEKSLYNGKKKVYNKDIRNGKPSRRDRAMLRRLNDENIDRLFRAILTLETVEECYDFFEDICTVDEVREIARRLCAAKLLREGTLYSEITGRTGLSTATISRVNRSMKYGNGGYDLVLDRMGETVSAEKPADGETPEDGR